MLRVSALLALFGGACSFRPAQPAIIDDAPSDQSIDTGPGCDFALHVDACNLAPAPANALTLTGSVTLDTDAMTFTPDQDSSAFLLALAPQKTDPSAMVVVLRTQQLTVATGAMVSTIGSHPLVILSDSSISVAGVIDAGSHQSGKAGAGASDAASCGAAAGGEGDDTGSGGGGGGGAFQTNGGAGGLGALAMGGANGISQPFPASLIGGCPGGAGGLVSGGGGGSGGGAVELSARTSIDIDQGGITVGGAGGVGGGQGGGIVAGGGGGGGAGGYLGLDAPQIVLTSANVSANGGGGGGGGNGLAQAGVDGRLGRGAASGGAGRGGASTGGGGGALAATVGGTAKPSSGGGGGGGGGVGYIRIHTAALTSAMTTISPVPAEQ